jgi:hypothetical protein
MLCSDQVPAQVEQVLHCGMGAQRPLDLIYPFGLGSEFGLENLLRFFGLPTLIQKPTLLKFGIRLVSNPPPRSHLKKIGFLQLTDAVRNCAYYS